jgi:ferrochelatase
MITIIFYFPTTESRASHSKTDITKSHCKIDGSCCNTHPPHEFCYRHQCYETTKQVVKLGIPEGKYSQTFQSRLAGDKWLTPYTDVEVNKMPGIKKLAVVTPVLSLIVETLEEIAWKPITSSKSMVVNLNDSLLK